MGINGQVLADLERKYGPWAVEFTTEFINDVAAIRRLKDALDFLCLSLTSAAALIELLLD